MKTLKLFLLSIVAVVMASCSGAGSAGLVSKISKGEPLTQEEYTQIIDYCGDYAKQAQVIQDKIDNLGENSTELSGLNAQMEALRNKFPDLKFYSEALKNATEEEVGSENAQKIDELSSLIWFDAPEWASTVSPEGAAGLVESVANADSTVVAAPELEEKVTSKL